MTLNEAIEHLETKDEVLAKQLTNWLRELREYRERDPKIDQFSLDEYLKDTARKVYISFHGFDNIEAQIVSTDAVIKKSPAIIVKFRNPQTGDDEAALYTTDGRNAEPDRWSIPKLYFLKDYDKDDQIINQ